MIFQYVVYCVTNGDIVRKKMIGFEYNYH